jgi:hypothetical protein
VVAGVAPEIDGSDREPLVEVHIDAVGKPQVISASPHEAPADAAGFPRGGGDTAVLIAHALAVDFLERSF